jgi:sulfonate transport system permease protein
VNADVSRISALLHAERPARRIASRPPVGLVLPVAILLAWEAEARFGVVATNLLPAPSAVVRTLADLSAGGTLLAHVVATLVRLFLGYVVGAGVATVLGVVCGRSAGVRAALDPTLQALRSIPSLAWVPLFLLWLGIQESSKVALIAVGAFFPVYLNLVTGIVAIDGKLVEVGLLHGYRGVRLAHRVLLPAVLPAYVAGLRSGLGLAWMFVVAAELLGASRGLGYLMVDGQTTGRPELVIAAILLFAVLGKLTDHGLSLASARFSGHERL